MAVPFSWLTSALCTPSRASRAFFTVASQWPHIMPSIWMVFFIVTFSVFISFCTGQDLVSHAVSAGSSRAGALCLGGASWAALRGLKVFSRRALVTTQTLERLMAAEAIIGFSVMPMAVKTPAASGIQTAL